MKLLTDAEAAEWVASQNWLALSDRNWFEVLDKSNLTTYEAKIAEDSACVGCDMANLFLHDVSPTEFPGALFWIARPVYASATHWTLVEQVLRAGGLVTTEQPRFLFLEQTEFSQCLALVALMLMFGWDANLVLAGRKYLLVMDDEPYPALITDQVSSWFAEAARNLDFKITQ